MAQSIDKSTLLKDIMTSPVISVTLTYTVYQVLKLAKDKNVTGFPIIDIGGKVIGIVSTLDLITDVTAGKLHSKLGELPLAIKVEKDVFQFNQYATLKDVLLCVIKERIGRIIIVDDNNKLCGIVSRKDLVNYFIDVFDLKSENLTARIRKTGSDN